MKRWSETAGATVENAAIDSFIEELLQLCDKHGLGLSHEDTHGAFIVCDLAEADREWLSHAHDYTTRKR